MSALKPLLFSCYNLLFLSTSRVPNSFKKTKTAVFLFCLFLLPRIYDFVENTLKNNLDYINIPYFLQFYWLKSSLNCFLS